MSRNRVEMMPSSSVTQPAFSASAMKPGIASTIVQLSPGWQKCWPSQRPFSELSEYSWLSEVKKMASTTT